MHFKVNGVNQKAITMKIIDDCPGAAPLKRPTIIFKTCPKCGDEIELFTSDVKMDCDNCGFTIYNDTMSCVQWCEYAKEKSTKDYLRDRVAIVAFKTGL